MLKKFKLSNSRMLFLLIGILLAISVSGVWAAWNSTFPPPANVTGGQTLTASLWNSLVTKLEEFRLKLVDLDGRVVTLESESGGLIYGNTASMSLPAGSAYSVIITATYFSCIDVATNLLLDGAIVKTHTGANGDSAGCDQNTILYKADSLTAGTHTWALSRGEQASFLWQAYSSNVTVPTNPGNSGTPCNWTGERTVYGNMGGCNDDLYLTCDGSNITNTRWGC